MDNKEVYRQLCETEGSNIPLFLQYWWLDTVCCGKQWDVLLSRDRQGTILGALPFLCGSRFGLRYVLQPQLTQYTGPWLRFHEEQQSHTVLQDLVSQLEQLHLAVYIQQCSPLITNWLPFYWKGYRQTTRYSYRVDLTQSTEQIFESFSKKERQKVRRDSTSLTPVTDISPELFAEFHQRHWLSRGQKDLLSLEFTVRVCREAISRGNGLLFGLRDVQGKLIAAWFVVYDDQCAYALMSALNAEHPLNGATSCLVWHLLQEMKQRTRIFDFEGSMDPGVEQLFRSLGGRQIPFFKLTKFRPRGLQWLLDR